MNVFIYDEFKDLVKFYLNPSVSFIREEEVMILVDNNKYRLKNDDTLFDFPIKGNLVLKKTNDGNYELSFNMAKTFNLTDLKVF